MIPPQNPPPHPLLLRRRRWVPAVWWIAAGVLLVTITALFVTSLSGPPTTSASSNPLRFSVADGCPGSAAAAGHRGVVNVRSGLNRSLLTSETPVAALACRYGNQGTASGSVKVLAQKAVLTAVQARALADSINRMTLSSGGGETWVCPADLINTETYLVFHDDRGPDVSLYFHPVGCPTLDNGHVITFGVSGDFQDTLQHTARM